jgi:uncharacterized protein (TIGR00159 family)
MLLGLSVMVFIYFIAIGFGLLTLAWVLGNFLSSIVLVIVVLFQDEIRRSLTKVGLQPMFPRSNKNPLASTVDDLTFACTKMAKVKWGALVVIQREVGLSDLVEDAVLIDCLVNRKLILSIFCKDSPLHDGALLIDGDRIRAAGCVLPLSFNPDLDPNLGTRHRAALGISERSDALTIVVSEENGNISIAQEGKLFRNLDPAQLKSRLERFINQSAGKVAHKIDGLRLSDSGSIGAS